MSRDGDIRRWKGKTEAKGEKRRKLTRRVKTSRGRKISSVRWLQRQLNDVYVQRAQEEGYRGRAAYKLIELDDRFSLIRKNKRVVDLGAAPGGWSQVAIQRGAGQVVGIDLLPIEPVDDVNFLEMDFTDELAGQAVIDMLQGPPDLVMSDMASNTTGHPATDHLRIVALVELAAEFAIATLAPGGNFVAKVFQGGSEGELLKLLKANFITVRHFKPDASRTESAETYVIAKTFRGRK
ncbi:MAG: RlmE family RNA methyltransferase [Robiginitomaculum sp.]|nr:RlmE family RNA methyltransferase [Robiginitomaculum sp.]